MLLGDIKEFALLMLETGNQYNSEYLIKWSNSLIQQIEFFNIEEVVVLWDEYPIIIKEFKKIK